uniref:Uncharacterized protein n=1 Tax=Oryza sativa subsp. japonica TaxID=39947 RepID=Q6YZT8_ORYSJ|nr:hypothetical protein [Oryza sativa Japonica Group]
MGGCRQRLLSLFTSLEASPKREHHSTGILDGTDKAYSSENPPSDTYSYSGRPSQGPPRSITPTLAWMRQLEESYTTSPAVAHAGLWADVIKGGGADRRGPLISGSGERGEGRRHTGPLGSGSGGRFTVDQDHAGGPPPFHGTDGPDRPRGRSDGQWRHGSAQDRPSGHGDGDGARTRVAGDGNRRRRRRRKGSADGRRC